MIGSSREDRRLGAHLVASGRVSLDQLERCLELQAHRRVPTSLAAILVEQGLLGEAEIGALSAHVARQGAPASAADAPLAAIGRFAVVDTLGKGGMGTVYRCVDRQLGREVAVKVIGRSTDQTERWRFEQEARAVARLSHPNIIEVLEVGSHEGRPYLVMALVDGEPLGRLIRRGPLAPARAARICLDVARALEHAHARGVLHRDVKPGNVLLTRAGEPILTDFGLARDVSSRMELTLEGEALGTPSFMAPEQTGGRGWEQGPPTDVYGVGALLYCCLTGQPPFEQGDGSVMSQLKRVVFDEPTPPRALVPQVPAELEGIVLRCLRKEPDERFASAEELARALERFLGESPSRKAQGRRERRREPRLAPLAAGAIGLAAGVVLTLGVVSLVAGDVGWPGRLVARGPAPAPAPAPPQPPSAEPAMPPPAEPPETSPVTEQKSAPVQPETPPEPEKPEEPDAPPRAEPLAEGSTDPETERAVLAELMAFYRAGRYRETVAAADAILADDARRPTAWNARGAARMMLGDDAGAIEDFGRAIEIVPRFASAWGNRGRARRRLSRWREALVDLDRAVSLAPDHAAYHADRGFCLLQIGELEPALAAMNEAVRLDPDRAAHWANRAGVHAALRDNASAEADLTRALELEPASALHHDNRAKVREARGDDAGALADLDRAIALDPRRASLYRRRVELRKRLGDMAGVVRDATRLLELDPEDVELVTMRSRALRALGDLDGALADADRAIALDPMSADAAEARGFCLLVLGRYEESRDEYSRAIALDPRSVSARRNRGVMRQQLGELQGALEDFERALQLSADDPRSLEARGSVLLQLGRTEEAEADLSRAIALDPTSSVAWGNRGRLRASRGDLRGALADLDRAVGAGDPADPADLLYRARVRAGLGDEAGRIADIERALALMPAGSAQAAAARAELEKARAAARR